VAAERQAATARRMIAAAAVPGWVGRAAVRVVG
jgi:hypothetical protein